MPEPDYEHLRNDRGALIKALSNEMTTWSDEDAASFIDADPPRYGIDAAVELLESRARSRQAAAQHEAAVADYVHAALA